ncbi:MAG: DMT family transporter [Dehalococcoidales bacterium]|nr:DMT family transporter [Dehalococcoidales bacterium]MDP7416151.1 DMT family transporter [Dehalococcoidales bacterium]
MLISISILLSPLAIILFRQESIVAPGGWFILGTVLLHALYFVLLGRSYTHADLSLAYPIARGIGPALVPILGAVVLNELVTPFAIVGIVTVIFGIYTVYWWGQLQWLPHDPFKLFRKAGTRYAILTGLINAVQSLWDKVGVSYVNPFLYMYLLAFGSAIVLAPYMVKAKGKVTVLIEGQRNKKITPVAGLLMFLAYGLILLAMQFTRVSYIIPAREVGIIIGVVLGTIFLGEPFSKRRIVGSCLITTGVALISIAQ